MSNAPTVRSVETADDMKVFVRFPWRVYADDSHLVPPLLLVNLGVALYLWGLLSSAGAQPLLTRTADTAVAPGTGTQLGDDLLARSNPSNSAHADLFISIHHNSNVSDPRKNDLAVFYKLAEPGPSRELATSVMERLREGFGEEKARVLPGNFRRLEKNRRDGNPG